MKNIKSEWIKLTEIIRMMEQPNNYNNLKCIFSNI